MEKTPRGTGGRVGGVISGKERGKLSSRPLPWPHSQAEAGPGPPRSGARPGPHVLETPLPSHVNGGGPGAGAPRPQPPHPESKLARRGDARHGVGPRSGRGRGHAADTLPVGPSAGSLISWARGAKGRRPALPSRRRTRRAAVEGALPAPARSRASSIARHPSSRSRGAGTANSSARLPGASKTTIRKWLQLNCFSAPPLRKCPRARGEQGRGVEGDSRAARGVWAALHAPQAKDTTQRAGGDAGNPPAPGKPAPPPPATHRVSGLRVHLAQVANHPNRFSWLRWAEARGSLALMAPRRRQRRRRRPAGSEGRLGRSRPPLGLA